MVGAGGLAVGKIPIPCHVGFFSNPMDLSGLEYIKP